MYIILFLYIHFKNDLPQVNTNLKISLFYDKVEIFHNKRILQNFKDWTRLFSLKAVSV